ncbi:MAG: hypothetical protein WCJ35_20135 [Planctomycetota bacterium]
MDDLNNSGPTFDWQHGYCHVFAVALHDALGYKLSGLQVDYEDKDTKFRYLPKGHVIEHVYAVSLDGEYFDSDGTVSPSEWICGYRERGLRARLRPLTRKQIMKLSGKFRDRNFYEFDKDAYAKAIEVIESVPEKYKSWEIATGEPVA